MLAACADERTGIGQAQRAAAFRRYGLPWRMPADKRGPWGTGGGEPTRFAVWLVDLDIRLVHGRPYHPHTQGKKCPRMSGAMDPIVPAPNAARLAGQLVGADARIAHRFLPAGHGLGEADLPP